MNGKKNLRSHRIALTAGVEYKLAGTPGDMFAVIGAEVPFEIIFDETAHLRDQVAGCGAVLPFEYQDIVLLSPASQTVTIVLGYGQYLDARASINATVNASVESANVITALPEVTVPAGASVQIAGANSNRKELRLGVKSTEASGIYFGGPDVGPINHGGYIEEGCAEYVSTEAAVWAYNPGTAAVTVNVMSLERV